MKDKTDKPVSVKKPRGGPRPGSGRPRTKFPTTPIRIPCQMFLMVRQMVECFKAGHVIQWRCEHGCHKTKEQEIIEQQIKEQECKKGEKKKFSLWASLFAR